MSPDSDVQQMKRIADRPKCDDAPAAGHEGICSRPFEVRWAESLPPDKLVLPKQSDAKEPKRKEIALAQVCGADTNVR